MENMKSGRTRFSFWKGKAKGNSGGSSVEDKICEGKVRREYGKGRVER